MKVLKFGGTSVGTVESLRHVKNIVENISGKSIVVVSALGGITDKLILTANKAAKGDFSYKDEITSMVERHENIINQLVDKNSQSDVAKNIKGLFAELSKILDGISLIGMLPEQVLDVVVSFGERLSSVIVTAIIKGAVRHDSLEFIKTEKWHGKNIVDIAMTNDLINKEFSFDEGVAIVPGFISRDKKNGWITNLGRGGSDYTAALIAAALDADLLEIWTDVDGFMTADPRIVKNAVVIPRLSFTESMELCTFGAKVVYPPTIYPVFHKNIPIKILNTFNYTAPGTLITDTQDIPDYNIKGISPLRNTALFTLKIKKERNDIASLSNRTLNALSKNGIRIFPVNNEHPDNEYSFSVSSNDAEETFSILKEEFAPEISNGDLYEPLLKDSLSSLAVVGADMKKNNDLIIRIENSLRREDIAIIAYSYGNSDTTISFMVEGDKTEKALQIVHNIVFDGI